MAVHGGLKAATIALVAVFLIGCKKGTERVFVDVAAILRDETPATIPSTPMPKPPPGMPATTIVLPGRPEQTIHDTGGTITTSVEQLEAAQRAAIKQLNARLRALYANEVARYARERLEAGDKVRSKAFADANRALLKEFLSYADERGPLLSSLAILSGWPDTNPESKGDPSKMRFMAKQNFLEAKRLRGEIAKTDAGFAAKAKGILASAQGVADSDLAQAQIDIEKFRDETNAKADAEAAREVRATPKQLDIRLAGARTMTLPAVPEIRYQLAASPSPRAVPQVTFTDIGNSAGERRRQVEQELEIWLGLNRYSLAQSPSGVPNRTDEFKAWQKTYLMAGH
jgi:hypothetical protein